MINIQIGTEIPKFFRDLHFKPEKISFEDYATSKFKEMGISVDINILSNLIENFKQYNEVQVRLPIYGNSINFFGNYLVFDEKTSIFVPSDFFNETSVEINLVDGYYYDNHVKVSSATNFKLIDVLSEKFNLNETLYILRSKSFLKEYIDKIDRVNLLAEKDLYEQWILFNLNILKK